MPPTDAMFLLAESREHPMHVGGLQLFTPPEDAGPDYARDMVDELRSHTDVSSRFRRRPADPVSSVGNTWWTEEPHVDLDYHIRHSAVPRPGRIRELFQLTSRWHGTLLDRHRPLWETHLVEGIEGGRIAVYSKVHHSLLDGVSALRVTQRALTDDPNDTTIRVPWDPQPPRSKEVQSSGGGPLALPLSVIGKGVSLGTTAAGLVPASLKVLTQAVRDHNFTTPFEAPRTMLNGPIGGARRFVAQSWEIERVRAVGDSVGATLNDVVLAMCSGALRRYLQENNALPDKSLTAMVPVSLRSDSDSAGGNSVGAVICSLATDIEDPLARLQTIRESAQASKQLMKELTPLQILLLSAVNMSALALSPLPGYVSLARPPFNIIISNVPGPDKPLYWNGSRLDGIYPASIALDGQAMNITFTSNDDALDFGIVGCRQTLPSLQRMIHHLEDALAELEKAAVA
ncbi:WS/DGAT/MGAT family O-acyltransferase [Williamsia deligens]|uniref:Diacylglycerol O-acyltransferase n=1 Tax=Williamsia deligens TaxID=321325 RepID=A0ABW3G827_9NOCA|nr:wax ester/triacylglycerol synthase family O-acyltransferase [Williamsia deligens]MCP2194352.1 acyltransferase, WS/DGAT/MGAT [Williamsia deligens]